MRRVCYISIMVAALAHPTFADDREPGAILDGTNYGFAIQTPSGWSMTATNQRGYAAFFKPKIGVLMQNDAILYISTADKAERRVNNPAEVNAADLEGIRKRDP